MNKASEIIKNKRLEKNLTLDQVEKGTKIRKKYLIAIENEQWNQFPSLTYILGTIKTYGCFLELDDNKLLAFFRREYESKDKSEFKTKMPSSHFTPYTRKIIRLVISSIILLFFVYFSFQLYLYFLPPKIIIIEPKKTAFYTDKVKLVGQTQKEAIVYINGQRVYLDKANKFYAQIPLISKKNAVTIEVTGANGRKTTIFKVFEKK